MPEAVSPAPVAETDTIQHALERLRTKFSHTQAGGELLATMLTSRQMYQMSRQRLAERLEQLEPEWFGELEMVVVRSISHQASEPIDKDTFLSGLGTAVQWAGREVVRPAAPAKAGPVRLPWGTWQRGRTLLILGEAELVEDACHHLATLVQDQLAADAAIVALGYRLSTLSPQGWLDLPTGHFFSIDGWTGWCNKREKTSLWARAGIDAEHGLLVVMDLAEAFTAPPSTRHAFLRAGQAHQRLRQHTQQEDMLFLGGLVEQPTDENWRWTKELFQAWATVARVTKRETGELMLELPDLAPYLWTPDE